VLSSSEFDSLALSPSILMKCEASSKRFRGDQPLGFSTSAPGSREGVYLMLVADEVVGCLPSGCFETFPPGCMLIPLATQFLM